MARILQRAVADGVASFVLSDEELKSMTGLFMRAGIDASIIDKLLSENDEVFSEAECRSFSKRIRMILSLRMVVWSEEIPTVEVPQNQGTTRSMTPKLVSKTIDRPMRMKCIELADFLAQAEPSHGCFIHSGIINAAAERSVK